MRIAFLGTPEFAVPSLRLLHSLGEPLCVFTQPDKKQGRGHKLLPPPVKTVALSLNIPVFQFDDIKTEGVAALSEFAPDLMITAAFGQILTAEILAIPRLGCINVHASLLPKYRGASPIQSAILCGEKITGVTTMQTDVGLDTGDILLKKQLEIFDNENAEQLTERLSLLGCEVLSETLSAIENKTLCPAKQDNSVATRCRMIKKERAKIDFSMPTQKIHDLVRAYNPWPIAFFELSGQQVKVFSTRKCENISFEADAEPGTCIVASPKEGLFVKTGDGVIEISELQFPNGKALSAKALLNSRKLLGEVLQ